MRCAALRCVAVRCGALRCVALRCYAVRCGAVRCGAVRSCHAGGINSIEVLYYDYFEYSSDYSFFYFSKNKSRLFRIFGRGFRLFIFALALFFLNELTMNNRNPWPNILWSILTQLRPGNGLKDLTF